MKARPPPVFSPAHQVSAQRIALHVPEHGQQVFVLLHGESLEAPLPDVPACFVALVVPPDVRSQEPLHPSPEVAVRQRPEHKVEMAWHEAEGQEIHFYALARAPEQFMERGVVAVVVEYNGTTVATVDYVVAYSPNRCPGSS
jgi:hypothetical protein